MAPTGKRSHPTKGRFAMPIKLIAVDMDGTFLDSRKKFNKERFDALYKRMLEKDIRFVVASGNQYYQLRSFSLKYRIILLLWRKMALSSWIATKSCPSVR